MSRIQLHKKKCASMVLTSKQIDNEVKALFNAFMDDLGCTFRARGSSEHLRRVTDSWESMKHDSSYLDPLDFFKQYAPANFFKKYFFDFELDQTHLQSDAKSAFLADCAHGAAMNEQLSRIDELPVSSWLRRVLSEAAEVVRGAVGDDLPIKGIFENVLHGPNATTNVRREDSYLDSKALNPSGSVAVESYWATYINWNSSLRRASIPFGYRPFKVQRWNKLSFVPKTAKKLRTMSVEPTTSMAFQRAYGEWLVGRLRDVCNIDVATQPDCHRMLVRLASLYPELGIATLDWSKASDRIWIVLIKLLFPADHFRFMMHVRSSHALIDGQEVQLPMMGTMGNGFTFPLQTLVFYSLLTALCRVHGIDDTIVSTFGDDCIVPTALLVPVKNLADQLGWQMNEEKSFFDGGFRESCGADMYRGVQVRPYFVQRPDTLKSRIVLKSWAYTQLNQIRNVFEPFGIRPDKCLSWLVDFHKKLELGQILVVPPRYGEGSGYRVVHHSDIPSHLSMSFKLPKPVRVKDKLSVYCDWQIQFECISNRVSYRDVLSAFYYVNTLEGKILPQEFKKGKVYDDIDDIPWTGEQPLKRCRYVHKTSRIHNWNYFMHVMD